MNLLNLLKADHQQIKHLLKNIQKPSNREKNFVELMSLVQAHSKAEEATLYEPLKETSEGRASAFEGYEEHHVVDTLFKEMTYLSVDEEGWIAKLTVLNESLKHHIKEEETEMFRIAKKLFTVGELKTKGLEFMEMKSSLESDLHVSLPKPLVLSLVGFSSTRSKNSGSRKSIIRERLASTKGRVGYLIAWLLGVPASLLFALFLIRGH